MSNEFGRRLRDMVDGVRADSERSRAMRAGDLAEARARRRHLEKRAIEEARRMLKEAEPVLAGLGLRSRGTPEEFVVEPIPRARLPEKFPPWLRIRWTPPLMEDAWVAVIEVTWRVDDPRTLLPEAPCTIRHVASDDSPTGIADLRDFLAVALEDFSVAVARVDSLPRA